MSADSGAADPTGPVKGEADGYDDPPMTIWDHLGELRKRLFYSIIALAVTIGVAWFFRELLFSFFTKPYFDAWEKGGIDGDPTLNFQSPAAGFLGYFKLSILGGAAFAAPIVFYQLWSFIAPGLYAREKKFVFPFVFFSTALFVGGGYFGWRLVFPLAFEYLLGFSGTVDGLVLKPTIMMGDYIDFVTRMLLGFGLIFEIPLIVFFLSVAGIINYLHLIRYGRWFVVGSFLAAALITPPDITSQVMMAVPMVFLYGGSILLAYVFGKPPTEEQKNAHKRRREEAKKEREEARLRKKAEKEALKKEREEEKQRIKAEKKAAKEAKKKG